MLPKHSRKVAATIYYFSLKLYNALKVAGSRQLAKFDMCCHISESTFLVSGVLKGEVGRGGWGLVQSSPKILQSCAKNLANNEQSCDCKFFMAKKNGHNNHHFQRI